jgi:cytochrome P450
MLSLHPEAAKLAQAEIDAVVGRERVPDLKDRESMPYMEAVLQEVMRLCPVVPLGTYKEASPTAEYSWLSQVSLIPLLRISNSEVIGFQRMQQLILTSGILQNVFHRGSVLTIVFRAMLRDPKHFASPHTFDPSRFLKPVPDPDPRKYIFGFGRRVCPGQHVASNAMWVMCAGILAAFNLEPGSELLTKVGRLGGPGSQQMYKLFQPHLV